MPYFSVIMPAYNHQAYIEEAVRSVKGQTFADWELLAVNDGSTDETPRILEKLAAQDRRIGLVHQKNGGPAAAQNTGAARARAPWLTYLGSDDLLFPETLAHYRAYLEAHPGAQFVYGYPHRLRGTTVTKRCGEHQDKATGTRELWERMFLNPIGVCHRRELWERAGGFDAGLRSLEDYDFFLRLSLLCRFEPIGKVTGLHRRHDSNISRRSGVISQREAEVLERFAEARVGGAVLEEQAVARRLGQVYLRSARQYFKESRYGQALKMLERARRRMPTWRGRWLALLSRCLRPWEKQAA